MRHIVTIQGLQYGSEAKGQIAGALSFEWEPDTVVTAWGPNAGHTFSLNGVKYIHSMLATSALSPKAENILIGPGSVLDVQKLIDEIKFAKPYLGGKNLIIHPQAVILLPGHSLSEKGVGLVKIGSTMKGTMAAAYDKMLREVPNTSTARWRAAEVLEQLAETMTDCNMSMSISSMHYDRAIDRSEKLMVEGAQGFSLGIHTDFYPYCTSRDVSTLQLWADCRIPSPALCKVTIVGVCRTFPIRVANRKDSATGEQFTSGGCYYDQKELDWRADLGREAELTTVTKLPRRVFSFSDEQIRQACRVIRPTHISLTFCDYLPQETQEGDGPRIAVPAPVHDLIKRIENVSHGAMVHTISFGPDLDDIHGVDGTRLSIPPFCFVE